MTVWLRDFYSIFYSKYFCKSWYVSDTPNIDVVHSGILFLKKYGNDLNPIDNWPVARINQQKNPDDALKPCW